MLVDVTNDLESPSDVVGARVLKIRGKRRWTRAQLGERCSAAGASWITASVINDIETGRKSTAGRRRRQVTVDELLALSLALDVSPLHLLVPTFPQPELAEDGETTDNEPYPVTPGFEAPCWQVRQFVQGYEPLPGQDVLQFLTERPKQNQPPEDALLELTRRRDSDEPVQRRMTGG